ncbi:MAG: CvpA family protein [Alphaproteobacteria bacterium]|nr:CvpA family protein [Alphaproteobacteria bacterium]
MSNLDLTLAAYLIITLVLAANRGFSVEVCDIIRVITAIITTFFAAYFLKETIEISIIEKPYYPISIYFSSYIFIGFFIKIIFYPVIILLKAFLPNIIDKLLGFILATVKCVLIFISLLVFVAKFSPKNNPNWLSGSYTEIIYEKNQKLLKSNLEDYQDIFDKFRESEEENLEQKTKTPKADQETTEPNNLLKKLEGAKDLLKYYKIMENDKKDSTEDKTKTSPAATEEIDSDDLEKLESLIEGLN